MCVVLLTGVDSPLPAKNALRISTSHFNANTALFQTHVHGARAPAGYATVIVLKDFGAIRSGFASRTSRRPMSILRPALHSLQCSRLLRLVDTTGPRDGTPAFRPWCLRERVQSNDNLGLPGD